MKKLLVILLSAMSLCGMAQTMPNWYELDMQRLVYPEKEYFKGKAEDNRQSGESLEVATKRISDAARAEAAASVRVQVQNTTNVYTEERSKQTMNQYVSVIYESLSRETRTSTDIEIPGMQVETWQNPQTKTIAAFAYVKKSSLIRQLEKKITVALAKIETTLEQTDQLFANGQKMQARDMAAKCLPLLVEVDETQKLLAAVDMNADRESLQLDETQALQKRLTEVANQLKNGINIYIACTADMFGTNYAALKGEIQGELSKIGCTFVENTAQADWAISIKASARKYSKDERDGLSTYFCYADATISLDKMLTDQRVYESKISEKGGHTFDYEHAAVDAYKYLAAKLIGIIQEQIA